MYLVSILQILEIPSIFIQNYCPSSPFNTQKQRSRPQRWFCCGCLSCSSCLSTSPLISQCLFRVGISALVMIQSLFKESRAEQLFSLILPNFVSSHRFVLGKLSLMSGSVGSSSVSDACVLHGQIR